MRPWQTALMLAVPIGIGSYYAGQSRPSIATEKALPVQGITPDTNSDLWAAMARIERRLAALELGQMRQKVTVVGVEPDKPSAPADRPDPVALEEKRLERDSAIEARLKTESRDGTWASAIEKQLETAVSAASQQGAQYSIKALNCLTSLCEMVLSTKRGDNSNPTGFLLSQGLAGIDSLDVLAPVSSADGSSTVTYRLFRQGYPRPDEGT